MNREFIHKVYLSSLVPLFTVGVMWLVFMVSLSTGLDFSFLGVYPRHAEGLMGIAGAPLVHGGIWHLFSNSVPLLLFGTALFFFYDRIALKVWLILYVFSSVLIWSFARGTVIHIGASGLIYGLAFFLFVSGVIRKNRNLAALSVILGIFYGGMIWGVLPGEPGISWEGHLSGAMVGVLAAVYYRKEMVEVELIDRENATAPIPDIIGDEWKSDHTEDGSPISYPNEEPQRYIYVYRKREDESSSPN